MVNLIYDSSDKTQKGVSKAKLNAGDNIVIVKIEAIREPGFNLLLYTQKLGQKFQENVLDKKVIQFLLLYVRLFDPILGSWTAKDVRFGDLMKMENYIINIFSH